LARKSGKDLICPGQFIELRIANVHGQIRREHWKYDQRKIPRVLDQKLSTKDWAQIENMPWPEHYRKVVDRLKENSNQGLSDNELCELTETGNLQMFNSLFLILKVPIRLRKWYE